MKRTLNKQVVPGYIVLTRKYCCVHIIQGLVMLWTRSLLFLAHWNPYVHGLAQYQDWVHRPNPCFVSPFSSGGAGDESNCVNATRHDRVVTAIQWCRYFSHWTAKKKDSAVHVRASFFIELFAAYNHAEWFWMHNNQKAIVWAQDAMLKYNHLKMVGKREGMWITQNKHEGFCIYKQRTQKKNENSRLNTKNERGWFIYVENTLIEKGWPTLKTPLTKQMGGLYTWKTPKTKTGGFYK